MKVIAKGNLTIGTTYVGDDNIMVDSGLGQVISDDEFSEYTFDIPTQVDYIKIEAISGGSGAMSNSAQIKRIELLGGSKIPTPIKEKYQVGKVYGLTTISVRETIDLAYEEWCDCTSFYGINGYTMIQMTKDNWENILSVINSEIEASGIDFTYCKINIYNSYYTPAYLSSNDQGTMISLYLGYTTSFPTIIKIQQIHPFTKGTSLDFTTNDEYASNRPVISHTLQVKLNRNGNITSNGVSSSSYPYGYSGMEDYAVDTETPNNSRFLNYNLTSFGDRERY